MLVKVTKAHFVKRDYLSETMRGIGGFGSTGEK
jgi:dUTPase